MTIKTIVKGILLYRNSLYWGLLHTTILYQIKVINSIEIQFLKSQSCYTHMQKGQMKNINLSFLEVQYDIKFILSISSQGLLNRHLQYLFEEK